MAKRAGQTRGWQKVEWVQYGETVTKTIKTFLATWKPAGGSIRVVIVKEEDDWLPYFCVDPKGRRWRSWRRWRIAVPKRRRSRT